MRVFSIWEDECYGGHLSNVCFKGGNCLGRKTGGSLDFDLGQTQPINVKKQEAIMKG